MKALIKSLGLGLILSATGFAAHAGVVTCTGQYQGKYDFDMTAEIDNNYKIVSDIEIVVHAGLFSKTLTMTPSTQDIQPGSFIRVSGTGTDATGTLTANFDNRSRHYIGSLDAQTRDRAAAHVPVECNIDQHQ